MTGIVEFLRVNAKAVTAFVVVLIGVLLGDPNAGGYEAVILGLTPLLTAFIVHQVPNLAYAEKAIAAFLTTALGVLVGWFVTGIFDGAELSTAIAGLVSAVLVFSVPNKSAR